jgi:hypothetical protein
MSRLPEDITYIADGANKTKSNSLDGLHKQWTLSAVDARRQRGIVEVLKGTTRSSEHEVGRLRPVSSNVGRPRSRREVFCWPA